MKTENKYLLILIVILLPVNLLAQSCTHLSNQYAHNAIKKAVVRYHQQKDVGVVEHMVIRLKLMKINENSGEFVLNYIFNDVDYGYLKPTHYAHVNEELILITVDSICDANIDKYGIFKVTEKIKQEALNKLAGPGVFVMGQAHPYMIFNYKRNRLKDKYHDAFHLPPIKYRY